MTNTLSADTLNRIWTVCLATGFLALGIAAGAYFTAGLFIGALEPGFAAANPGVEGWYHRLLGITLTYFAVALIGPFLLDQHVERVNE